VSPYEQVRPMAFEAYNAVMVDVRLFFSSRIVQLLCALTWARLWFPDWVEAVGQDAILGILTRVFGGS